MQVAAQNAMGQMVQQPVVFYMCQGNTVVPVVMGHHQQAALQQQLMQQQMQQQFLLNQQLLLVQQPVQQQVQMIPLVPTATSSTLNSNSSASLNDKEETESNVTHDSFESTVKTSLGAVPVLKAAKQAAPALKSTATTPVSGLAGAIAKRIREHGDAEIIALGVEGTNQAVKAMALARTFIVQEGMTLLVSPTFTGDEDGDEGNVMFKAEGKRQLTIEDTSEEAVKLDVSIRVSANSNIRKTAGAIAKLMRGPGQQGKAVGILTMGAESVHVTTQAVTAARTMLDQDSLDICFKPRFIHVDDEISSQPKPALRLTLYLTQKN
eukprot:TRINITY_DN9528_c0_g1_i1.p1 TRINITY_DN9528_c0_g1~~TRINITY_DN9528_c0_g1_i1.p1  ORF type:complete len:322 (+),score=81.63 TRINITY_DN9528_c0_g1_i1:267-1232(+)